MSSNYYQIYLEKVLQLAATIVIKSEATAEAQNRYVEQVGAFQGIAPVDRLDPTTWKYYLNLAGDYHAIDELMHVRSMDTLETILFNRQNLLIHRATARGYQYGTRAYKELVARFPDQERLIRGILYPVETEAAIAAPDNTILGYPEGLGFVEPNEYNLINRLQEWLDRYRARWYVSAFSISDPLYDATSLGLMYLHLVPAIINLRLMACKTNEAHSFHVRQYLASHGLLDVYVDSLTLKQALFFYRNIPYIERNAGKRGVFEWLVEHIMTERGFPLAEYVMRHNLLAMPDEPYPELTFRRNSINTAHASSSVEAVSLHETLIKEDELARDNSTYRDDYEPVIQEAMQNSRSNVVLTKLLESVMIDYANANPHPLAEVLFNEWLSQAASGTYVAYVGVANPRSGEWIPLTVKEAFIFSWYAFCSSIGIDMVEVPAFYAVHVRRDPLPTTDELKSIVDGALVGDELVTAALANQPALSLTVSIDSFYDLCVQIHDAIDAQRDLIARQEHHERRAMVQAMCKRIYRDRLVRLEPEGTTYESWFAARNVRISDFSAAELQLVGENLMKDATGLSLHPSTSLRDLQRAMVRMLGQLSSYSIQITSEINDSKLQRTDWTAVRVGDVVGELSSYNQFADVNAEPLDVQGSMSSVQEVPIGVPRGHKVLSMFPHGKAEMEINVEVQSLIKQTNRPSFMRVANVLVELAEPLPENDEGIQPLPGLQETYLLRNNLERQAIRDIYNSPYLTEPPEMAGDLSQKITNRVLDGLLYIPPQAVLDDDNQPILDGNGDFIIAA